MSIDDFADQAVALVRATAPIARQYFRKAVPTDYKADASPVTLADKAIESHLRQGIERLWPNHAIIGEEFPDKAATGSPYTWIIDPIDGTKAFLTGRATFCTLLALCHNERPILGLIYQPILDELWLGVDGQTTRFNGSPVAKPDNHTLAASRLATTAPDYFTPPELTAFNRLSHACALTVYGGDAYNYGLLTLGHIDVVAEAGLKFHDIAALIPVLRGAGCCISSWDRDTLTKQDARVLACLNHTISQQAKALLAL